MARPEVTSIISPYIPLTRTQAHGSSYLERKPENVIQLCLQKGDGDTGQTLSLNRSVHMNDQVTSIRNCSESCHPAITAKICEQDSRNQEGLGRNGTKRHMVPAI